MAKGERQGREAKKPKKDKTKATAAATPLDIMRARPTSAIVPHGKKK